MLGALVSWIAIGVIGQLTNLARVRQELEQRVALLMLEKDNLSRKCVALSRENDAQAARNAELNRFVSKLASSGFIGEDALGAVGQLNEKERELIDMAGKRVREIVESAQRKAFDALYEADRALRSEARQVLRRHLTLVEPETTDLPEAEALRKEA